MGLPLHASVQRPMQVRLQPGDRIGDATIEQALGEGGFARVYQARTDDGQPRAIKVAHEATESMRTTELALLQNEIEAVLQLRHSGLVQTHGYGYLPDGRLYLVMDLVAGIPLIDHVEKHDGLDTIEALAILERVATVMAYCHEQGVLHLDLKPENIVITDRHGPTIKVLDFGVAGVLRAGRGEQRVIAGTPAYMAPECFGNAERHPSMDVYSLGVTLHVMIAGELPYGHARGVTSEVALKAAGPPALDARRWAEAPPEVRDLLRAMLAVAPQERPSMALLGSEARRLYFAALTGEGLGRFGFETTLPPSQPIRVTQLFGRDEAMRTLQEHWARARERPGSATLVLGAQGTGKSAFIDDFIEHHADAEPLVAYGRCRESGDLLPFGVIREAAGHLGEKLRALPQWRQLGRTLREALGSREGVLLGLVPEAQPEGTPRAVEPSARLSVQAVTEAVSVLVEVVARQRPLLLVVEDLQWAHDDVLAVLETAAARTPAGMLLLLSSREPLGWSHEIPSIELGNLEPVDNDRLLRALLSTDDTTVLQRLRQYVPVLAAGIPMASVSVTADLQLRRCIRRSAPGVVELREDRLRAYVPPWNVVELLEQRLGRLTPAARRVLAAGSLHGRSFDMDDLLGLRELDMFGRADIKRAILDAHYLGLLQLDGRRCSLAHDALVERLAADWDDAVARRIHDKIAERLDVTDGDPGRLAHHLELAGRLSEAVQAHKRAAWHADAQHDVVGAALHFRRVIELAHDLPGMDRRVDTLREAIFEYARVAGAQGIATEAFAVVHRGAMALAEHGAEDDVFVDSAMARLHYLRGEMAPAVALSRRCLSRAGDGPQTARIRLLPVNLVGRALYMGGRFGEAAVALAQGCQLAASQGEQVELCHSLGMLGLSLGFTGDGTEARAYLERSSRLAQEVGDPVRRVAALCYEAIGAECAYDWRQGVLRSTEALALAEAEGIDGLYPTIALVCAGRHQFHVGHLQRARLLLDHAIERGRRHGVISGHGWAQAFLGDIAFVEGDYEDAARCYDCGLESAPDDQYTRVMCLVGRAHVRGAMGTDAALMHADAREALACLEAVDNVATRAHTLVRYAEATEALDGPAQARPRLAEARAVFERLGIEPVDWWPVPPEHAEVGVGARAYWQARAYAARPPPMEIPPLPPRLSPDVLRRITEKMTAEAHTLQVGPPRPQRPDPE
ncbi:MAG: protein kinase [Myxococcota bacterium]